MISFFLNSRNRKLLLDVKQSFQHLTYSENSSHGFFWLGFYLFIHGDVISLKLYPPT